MHAPWRFVLPIKSAVEDKDIQETAVPKRVESQPSALAPRKAVARMAPYHPPTAGRRNKLRLDFNENTVGAPPHVIDFIKRFLTAADLSIYPEYDHALEDLSRHFSVGIDEMTIANGTDEAIQLLINTYVDDGDEVLLLRPSYAMYRFYSELAGARIHEIDYQEGTLAFPAEELLERISPATRAILISNPNNPTGTGTSVKIIEQILNKAAKAAVFVDEAYYEFSGVTLLPLIPEYGNLFVSRTFSKTYGMAAMRCGCLFSQAANMAYVRKAQSPYSVNALAAMAARIAVEDSQFVEEYVLEVLAARELLYVGLERLKIRVCAESSKFRADASGRTGVSNFERAARARCVGARPQLRIARLRARDRGNARPGTAFPG